MNFDLIDMIVFLNETKDIHIRKNEVLLFKVDLFIPKNVD